MRIKELNEGFTSGFKAGYGSSSLSKPAKEPKKSPLNLIGDRDLKTDFGCNSTRRAAF